MHNKKHLTIVSLVCIANLSQGLAFDSGSTGEDGDFSPNSSITVDLPESGILNFNSINIPSNVTVNFTPNSSNTPAILLVANDAIISGQINLNGIDGGASELLPPAAYKGGGRTPFDSDGINGSGPGGGIGGIILDGSLCGGTGAGYLTNGIQHTGTCSDTPVGKSYGSSELQPLLGGSGGGVATMGVHKALALPEGVEQVRLYWQYRDN